MTSSGEPAPPGRKASTLILALVIVAAAALWYVPWLLYGTHNVFDAIMVDEWQEATNE
jgi:hypothetical protein